MRSLQFMTLLCLVVLAGCSAITGQVLTVNVNRDTRASVDLGDTVYVTATHTHYGKVDCRFGWPCNDDTHRDVTVDGSTTWSVSNPSVATFGEADHYRNRIVMNLHAPGTTQVCAKYSHMRHCAKLTVAAAD